MSLMQHICQQYVNLYDKLDKIANQTPQQLVSYSGLGALQGSGLLHDNDAV